MYNEKLLNSDEIISLLGQGLNLPFSKKSGNSYFFLCPFHKDRKPSLVFQINWKSFKCFACNFSAYNIFEFWHKFKKGNVEFRKENFYEVLEEIQKLGYLKSFSLERKEEKEKEDSLITFLSLVSDIYQNNLWSEEGSLVFNYLIENRKIDEEFIKKFGLGSSVFHNQISNIFDVEVSEEKEEEEKSFGRREYFASNLFHSKNNKVYDYFLPNQLIIPLKNSEGSIVSFCSRKIKNSEEEEEVGNKYNYLPIYNFYQKSNLLYNYHHVLKANYHEFYLVEGFFDVISLSSKKIDNVIALMGTSLSQVQLILIKKLRKRVVIFLDGDRAGFEATNDIALRLLKEEVDCEIVKKDYLGDPDEICRQGNEIHELIAKRDNPFNYIVESCAKKWEIKLNPQRIPRFIEEVAKIFLNYKANIKDFVIEIITSLTTWEKREVIKTFYNLVMPSVHKKQMFIDFVLLLENQLIFLAAYDRRNWIIIHCLDYFFLGKLNKIYFEKISKFYHRSYELKSFNGNFYHFDLLKFKNKNLKFIVEQTEYFKKFIKIFG